MLFRNMFRKSKKIEKALEDAREEKYFLDLIEYREQTNRKLKKEIENLRIDNKQLRDKYIKLEEENSVLYEEKKDLQIRLLDYENNIEILRANLPRKIKEVIAYQNK